MLRVVDRLEARAGSYLSHLAASIPPLGDRLIACENPSARRLGYSLAKNRAHSIDPADWSYFSGDPNAGRWPADYKKVGVLLGRASLLGQVVGHNESFRLAVGWEYKDSILVGILPNDYSNQLRVEDGRYEIGMRVGTQALRAAMGVYDLGRKEFSVPYHASSTGPTYDDVLAVPTGLLIL